jgi:hypothetical protein
MVSALIEGCLELLLELLQQIKTGE